MDMSHEDMIFQELDKIDVNEFMLNELQAHATPSLGAVAFVKNVLYELEKIRGKKNKEVI